MADYGCRFLPEVSMETNFIFPWSDKEQSESSPTGHHEQGDRGAHVSCSLLSPESRGIGDAFELPWKIFSREEGAGAVALQLLQDSWYLFKHLRLDNWIQQAMGNSSAAVVMFNAYHSRLSYSLFNFLGQFPAEVEKYAVIAKTLQRNDPFLCMAVAHAVSCHEKLGYFESFVLDAGFIILPLKTVLTCPDKHVLRRLSALEVRYNRYRTSPALARGEEFPVDTDFLLLISEHPAKAIALQMSQDALREFHQLSTHNILAKDDVLRRLGTRWDRLCRETEEMAAIQDLRSKLETLILSLHGLRNFFSLSAVLSGLSLAGQRLHSVSHLFGLVDSASNYKLYRTTLDAEPSLPFLYPLIVEYTRGNRKTLMAIFSFLSYHHYLEETFGYRALQI